MAAVKKTTKTTVVEAATATATAQKAVESVKKKVVFSDDTLIVVRSAVFGGLVYVNHKTGEKTTWNNYGETQVMTMRDLRDMRAGNVAFYENNWIFIAGIESPGFDDATTDDVYEALFIQKYYKNILDLNNFEDICSWDESKIRKNIPLMTENAKFNLVVALNEFIKDGKLDSLRKIRCFEDVLHCELEEV